MNLDLCDKVALVTGSSRGIGLGIARTLKNEGCNVILNGRDPDILLKAANQLDVQCVVGDVADANNSNWIIEKTLGFYGKLDIVVANVGNGNSTRFGDETNLEWKRMLNINLESTINIVSASKDHLVKTKGVIVCVSSICGLATLGAPIAYSAAKAALNSYIRGMSIILAKNNIRILGVAPGNVMFPGSTWELKLNQNSTLVNQMLEDNVPLRRLGTVNEIADVVTFLCSPRASFMTGTVVVIDGGQIKQ